MLYFCGCALHNENSSVFSSAVPLLWLALDAPGLDYRELQGRNTPKKALARPPRSHPKRINFSNVVLSLLINNFSFCSVRLNWSGCKYSFAGKLALLQAAINHWWAQENSDSFPESGLKSSPTQAPKWAYFSWLLKHRNISESQLASDQHPLMQSLPLTTFIWSWRRK